MATSSRKRSVSIARHRTSVSLEEPFWEALRDFAKRDGRSLADLIREIDKTRGERSSETGSCPRGAAALNLSAAIRLYVLGRLQKSL